MNVRRPETVEVDAQLSQFSRDLSKVQTPVLIKFLFDLDVISCPMLLSLEVDSTIIINKLLKSSENIIRLRSREDRLCCIGRSHVKYDFSTLYYMI